MVAPDADPCHERQEYRVSRRPACTIFFTGLPASGKSTLANALMERLLAEDPGPVTLLDGDVVRKRFSPELGYSRNDREINLRRVGLAAADVVRSGGMTICALIAPYDDVRKDIRRTLEPLGPFVLVYLSTPLAVCEERDPKGLYAKARAGAIEGFTGVSDPYEPPSDADVVIDTTALTPAASVDRILVYLKSAGIVGPASRV
jgi:sulfate adenylyltransferase